MTTDTNSIIAPLYDKGHQPVEFPVLRLEAIAALNAAVIAADAASKDGYSRRDEVRQRRAALETRLADLPVIPAEAHAQEAEMAAALAANPAALPDEAEFAAATQRRVEARRAHEARAAQSDILRKALARIDEEIAGLDIEIQTLASERVAKWTAFLEAAHPYLVDQFRHAFAKLVVETLGPISDLQNLYIEGNKLIPPTAWALDAAAHVSLVRTVPYVRLPYGTTGFDHVADVLFQHDGRQRVSLTSEAIERFRTSLPGSATK